MTTQQISIFLEAAKQLNFTAAAERLFITQPTLSRQIGLLEDELNAKLFNRVNNNVTLTPAGELLLQEFTSLNSQIDQLHFRISSINCGFTGSLRIALSYEQLVPDILKEALRIFSMQFPQIEIVMCRLDSGPMFERLFNCTVDIGFNPRSNADIDAFAAKLDAVIYDRQTECLAIRSDYAADLPDRITLEQCAEVIRKHPCYLPSISSFNNPLKNFENDAYFMLEQKPFATPQRIFRTLNETRRMTDYRFVRELSSVYLAVECGLGCTFSDTRSALSTTPNITLIPLIFPESEPFEPVQPVFLYNHNNGNPPLANFLQILRDLLTD